MIIRCKYVSSTISTGVKTSLFSTQCTVEAPTRVDGVERAFCRAVRRSFPHFFNNHPSNHRTVVRRSHLRLYPPGNHRFGATVCVRVSSMPLSLSSFLLRASPVHPSASPRHHRRVGDVERRKGGGKVDGA